MKKQQRLSVLLALGLAVACSPAVNAARVISTFDPGGADAEVREANPTIPRGTNNGFQTEEQELGLRENSTHNGHLYLKFGVSSVTPAELLKPIKVRTYWGGNNVANSRIEDENDQNNELFANTPNVAFEYYVLNPNNPGADWDESRIAYRSSPPTTDPNTGDPTGPAPVGTVRGPGLNPVFDGDFATDDILIDANNFTLLGVNHVRSLNRNSATPTAPIENRLPVGEAFEITFGPGSPLHLAISAAQLTGHQTVTVLTTLQHDYNQVTTVANAIGPSPDWNNHNYIFIPKERTFVTQSNNGIHVLDPTNSAYGDGYDNDVTDTIDWNPDRAGIQPPHSPWYGQANTQSNPFAPQLVFIPEPGSMVLAGICGLSVLIRRRLA